MGGINGGEGGLMFAFALDGFAQMMKFPDVREVGVGMDLARAFLGVHCAMVTPMSVNLCVDFVIDLYKLDEATDDKDRAVKIMMFLGKSINNY